MLNKVLVIGHLGADAEMRYTKDRKPLVTFSVAVSEKRKGEEHTEWFQCSWFGETAGKLAEYLKKGTTVFVEGKQQTRSWTDDSGQKRFRTETFVFTVQLLGGKGGGQRRQEEYDDLPFE